MGWFYGLKILILWGFTEKSDFQGRVHEKAIYRRELPKKGGSDSLQMGACRGGGVYPNVHYVDYSSH